MEQIFKGLNIGLSGFGFKEDRLLKKKIQEYGGKVSFIVSRATSVLIATPEERLRNGFKVKKATEIGIPVVSVEWLYRSVDQRQKLSEKDFENLSSTSAVSLERICFSIPEPLLDYVIYKSQIEDFIINSELLSESLKQNLMGIIDMDPKQGDYYDFKSKIPAAINKFLNPLSKKGEENSLVRIKSILQRKSDKLGVDRLRMTEIVLWLLELRYQALDIAIKESGVIPVCIDLFFEFPNCSVYHALTTHMIQNVLEGSCNLLKFHVLVESNLIGRILENGTNRTAGFFGHFLFFELAIDECAKKVPYLAKWLSRKKEWNSFVTEKLLPIKESQVQPFVPPSKLVGAATLDWGSIGKSFAEDIII